MTMIANWRAWVLLVLLVGPVLAYIGFGALWLIERGWLLYAGISWIVAGIAFAVLAARWTRTSQPALPPLDWDAPRTFSPFDRQAWTLVEASAEEGDSASMDALSDADIYIAAGRSLTRQLASHYHPLSENPIEHVPVVELLTALELAAEDLNRLCRQLPGGDLVTPAHLKTAVQAAGFLQRASDIYSYLLPLFSPVTGLVRLGTQQWMVKPAWRNMQQNLLRWFFRAYVNRLGTHLIELYSGRLVIGAEQYRRLTRRSAQDAHPVDAELGQLVIAVAGARDSGKSSVIAALDQARQAEPALLKARLSSAGIDETLVDRLRHARLREVPGFTLTPEGESARDRATRRSAVEAAADSDLLILIVDVRRPANAHTAEIAFAQSWDRWFVEHPVLEAPPTLVVLTGVDRIEPGAPWTPPWNWTKGQTPHETAVRARVEALRAALPPTFTEFVAVGLHAGTTFGVLEEVLPRLAALLHRAERTSIIRQLHRLHSRSKARRLVSQVSQHGRAIWKSLRSGWNSGAGAEQASSR
jgi:predicted GTPase